MNSGVCLPCSLNSGHMPPLFSEQWRWHDTLFSEQCIMVEFPESSIFMLFIFLHSARDLALGPCTVNGFFLLIKRLFFVFLKKTQLLTRSQTGLLFSVYYSYHFCRFQYSNTCASTQSHRRQPSFLQVSI